MHIVCGKWRSHDSRVPNTGSCPPENPQQRPVLLVLLRSQRAICLLLSLNGPSAVLLRWQSQACARCCWACPLVHPALGPGGFGDVRPRPCRCGAGGPRDARPRQSGGSIAGKNRVLAEREIKGSHLDWPRQRVLWKVTFKMKCDLSRMCDFSSRSLCVPLVY